MKLKVEDWIAGERMLAWSAEVLARQDVLDGGVGGEPTFGLSELPALTGTTANNLAVIHCQQCKKRFTRSRKTAKYCSPKCRQRAKRRG